MLFRYREKGRIMETRKVCMNEQCGASLPSSIECKKGWPLRSGELASLCDSCGTVYEQLVFCDTFHSKDTGWRECTSCGKRLHCGCIASSSLLELLDTGGVKCISCSESHGLCSTSSREKCKDSGVSAANGFDEKKIANVGNQSSIRVINKMKFAEFGDDAESNDHTQLPPSQTDDAIETINQMKPEETFHPVGNPFLSFLGQSTQKVKPNDYMENVHGSSVRTNLTISLSATSGNTDPLPATVVEEKQLGKKVSSLPQGSKSRHLLPKPPKSILAAGLETNASTISQMRVARPPIEGRVKNQLLPRYWPRITDQELQQISGDSNSTVVPLFEKVLSASDAGRIGRLVLPKACAEAYFPPISQPEGLPLRIQDFKGKEWVFQFRFWPNNNSRMYVLEGVTPCIQSMQLQAGDTVTFSRMDPEGKLLMGFRKASNNLVMQDKQPPSMPNGTFSSEQFFLPVNENLHAVSGHSGLLQPLKGRDFPLSALSKHFSSGDFSWHVESNGGKTVDGPMNSSPLVPERKRNRNIGSKNKRLLIDSQDALELRLSWEELQDMLRPPSTIEPSTVTIEDYEFEEYEQPPVFGKKSIFTVRLSGEQEQWVQCDSCLKWRRIPADILLPPKWTCQDNTWSLNRASCSVPDELSPQELSYLLQMSKELKKKKLGAAGVRSGNLHESSNPDALENSTLIGGNTSELAATSVAATTKHPRHRPGCSCIVCIQPPSGKGKHKPTCTCNVCMTVKRRFKTLMMRKKKRQSEREAEIAQRNQFVWERKEEGEVESIRGQLAPAHDPPENHRRLEGQLQIRSQINEQSQEPVETGNGRLDLNSCPDRENLHMNSPRISMVSLLQEASLPLETYLKKNGLTSLVSDQQASSGSHVLQQPTRESENLSHGIQEPEDGTEELSETDQSGNDPS